MKASQAEGCLLAAFCYYVSMETGSKRVHYDNEDNENDYDGDTVVIYLLY